MIQPLLERIEGLIEHVIQVRQWLLDDLSLKEARMSNRSADDVRIFTYATVIFLPLSFVSSVFSMQGAPHRATVQPFIIAAVVALLATIAFLLNAGTPMRNITYYKNKTLKLPQDDSIMEHADSQWKAVLEALHLWLVRLPAHNVLIARDILSARQKTRKRRKKRFASTGGHEPSKVAEGEKTGPLEQAKSILDDTRGKQQRKVELKEKQKWRRDTAKIIVGILVLPLFLFVSTTNFIYQNLFDLAKLLFLILPRYVNQRREASKEDHQSILSHNTASADEQAKKNTKKDDTADAQQKLRRDLRDKEKKYQDSNLMRFMTMPRIDDLGKHLQKGETLGTARKNLKAERKDSKQSFRDIKRKYMKARKKVSKIDGKIPEIDPGFDISSDDSSDYGKNSGKEDQEHRSGRSISGLLRRHFRESKQQERDTEKAGAEVFAKEM